ncbi:hypothetical protein RYX36_031090 [Vicia faba]
MGPSVPNGVSVGGVGAISNVQMNEDPRKRSLSKSSSAREPIPRKSIDTFGQRTSQYRGVTRHRWTGRYEAHLWDNSCRKEGQTKKGSNGITIISVTVPLPFLISTVPKPCSIGVPLH